MITSNAVMIGLVGSLLLVARPASAAPFTLTSPDFKDGAILTHKTGANDPANPNCRGENISPAFAWANPPAGTKSFAFLEYDPDGGKGLGVSHLVTYGIAATATGFEEGGLSDPKNFVGGKSTPGKFSYYGGCPAPGTGLHHYNFSVIATDLAPNALEPGLTREEFFTKLKGHALGVATIIGLMGYE